MTRVPAEAVVRSATAADVDAIADLETTCLPADPWSRALVADGVAGGLPTVAYLVAELAGEVVGHAVVSTVGDDAELQRIAVAPLHRRAGLARQLLRAAAAHARAGGAERLLLEVRETNGAALALYAAEGFTELARRPRYYRDGTDAVVMVSSIRD